MRSSGRRLGGLDGVGRLDLDVDELLLDFLGLLLDVVEDGDARLGRLRLDDELVEQEQADVVVRALRPETLNGLSMMFRSLSSERKKNEWKPTVTSDSMCPSKFVNMARPRMTKTNVTMSA